MYFVLLHLQILYLQQIKLVLKVQSEISFESLKTLIFKL